MSGIIGKHASNFIDLTGKRFGNLTAVSFEGHNPGKSTEWECVCDCGNTIIKSIHKLQTNKNLSCGCIRNKRIRKPKHGLCKTRIFRIWRCMHNRCTNIKDIGYKYYGSKGITICDEWKDVRTFADWANNNGYTDILTLDRIDSCGNYDPDNCRWSTMLEQENNRSDNVLIEYNGETNTLSNMCRKYNKKYNTMHSRLKKGWTVSKAFNEPLMRKATNK